MRAVSSFTMLAPIATETRRATTLAGPKPGPAVPDRSASDTGRPVAPVAKEHLELAASGGVLHDVAGIEIDDSEAA